MLTRIKQPYSAEKKTKEWVRGDKSRRVTNQLLRTGVCPNNDEAESWVKQRAPEEESSDMYLWRMATSLAA
jgi:hypothetical protein